MSDQNMGGTQGPDTRWERRQARWEARQARWADHRARRGPVLAIAIIAIGALFLLQNLGFWFVEDVWQYWPVLLIAYGVSRIVSGCHISGKVMGGVVAGIGALLLLNNLKIILIRGDVWEIIWPVLLIGWGASMLVGRAGGPGSWFSGKAFSGKGTASFSSVSGAGDTLHEIAVFGGIQRRIDSQNFAGGEIQALFGGVEIDLRGAATNLDEIVIEANAIFGGIEVITPEGWKVSVRGTGIFGGYEDKTLPRTRDDSKRPHLIIRGGAIFGGVTIR